MMSSVVLAPAVAGAADLSLPTDTVVYAAPGSLVELGRVPVDTNRAGPLCTWQATATNQDSAHPGNDIVVTSGGSELVLSEVEATEGKVTTNTGSAYLVNEVVVTLRMGPDGVFSGGLDLTIRYDQCTTPPAETTTAPEPPTTDVTLEPLGPSTSLVPTTAAPPTTVSTTATPTTATTIDVEPAGPVLPVTGTEQSSGLALGGLALIGLGGAVVFSTRRAAR